MNCLKRLRKCFSGVIVVTFFVTNTLTPAPVAYASAGEILSSKINATQFSIPSEFGKVTEIIPSSQSGQVLIHIQEAHANYDAQKNIQSILQYLAKDYGIKLVLLEGAGDKLTPELFKFFPENAELQQKVNDELLKAGELTGAEVFLIDQTPYGARSTANSKAETRDAVRRTQNAVLAEGYGVEDAATYGENREAYRKVYEGRKLTDSFLNAFYRQWQKSSGEILSKPLREFLDRESAFEEARLPLQDWMMFLKSAALRDLKLDLDDTQEQRNWPVLVRYFRLKKLDSQLDPLKVQKEKESFLKDLRGRKIPATLLEEIAKLLESKNIHDLPVYKTRFAFERLMDLLPKDYSFDAYPAFRLYLQQRILLSELQSEPLQEEIKTLIRKETARLIKTVEESKLVEALRSYRLLRKLFRMELSREEYREIQSQKSTPEKITISLGLDSSKLSPVTKLFKDAIRFYDGAIVREDHMMRRARQIMGDRKEMKAVIITGGFHTEGFKEKITASGSSYIGITPAIGEITADAEKNYLTALLGANAISHSHIAPEVITQPSFFKGVSPRFWRRELAVRLSRIRDIVGQTIASFQGQTPENSAEVDRDFQKLIASAVGVPSQRRSEVRRVERPQGKLIFSLTQAELQGVEGVKVFAYLKSLGIEDAALQNSILTVQSKSSAQVYTVHIGNEKEATPSLAVDKMLTYIGIRDISDVVFIEGHSIPARGTNTATRLEMREALHLKDVSEGQNHAGELWSGYEAEIAGVFGVADSANERFIQYVARNKFLSRDVLRSETRSSKRPEVQKIETWTEAFEAIRWVAEQEDISKNIDLIRQISLRLRERKKTLTLNRSRDYDQYPEDIAEEAITTATQLLNRAKGQYRRPIKELILALPYSFSESSADLHYVLWSFAADLDERLLRTKFARDLRHILHGGSFSYNSLSLVQSYLSYLDTGDTAALMSQRIFLEDEDKALRKELEAMKPEERRKNEVYQALKDLEKALMVLFEGAYQEDIVADWMKQRVVRNTPELSATLEDIFNAPGDEPLLRTRKIIDARRLILKLEESVDNSVYLFHLYHLDKSLGQMMSLSLAQFFDEWDQDGDKALHNALELTLWLASELFNSGFITRYTEQWSDLLRDPELSFDQLKDILNVMEREIRRELAKWVADYYAAGTALYGEDYERIDGAIAMIRKEKFATMAAVKLLEKLKEKVGQKKAKDARAFLNPEVAERLAKKKEEKPFAEIVHIDDFKDSRYEFKNHERKTYGGKGSYLMRMNSLGLPIPSAFVIPAYVGKHKWHKKYRELFQRKLKEHIERLEADWSGKTGTVVRYGRVPKTLLGEKFEPLFLSVRSGAVFVMPGIFETAVSVGFSPEILEYEIKRKGARPALSAYLSFVESMGVSLGISREEFEKILQSFMSDKKLHNWGDLQEKDLRKVEGAMSQLLKDHGVFEEYQELYRSPEKQLELLIGKVFESWDASKAKRYRREKDISSEWYTPVVVQAYVFGDLDENSGAGIALSHDLQSGGKIFGGEWLPFSHGMTMMQGRLEPDPMEVLNGKDPDSYEALKKSTLRLEEYFGVPQMVEFTIESGKPWILQTVHDQRVGRGESFPDLDWNQIKEAKKIGEGNVAFGEAGALRGFPVFEKSDMLRADVIERVKNDPNLDAVIFTSFFPTTEDSPDVISAHKILRTVGKRLILLTAQGGLTSHAAVVANYEAIPTLVSVKGLEIDKAKGVTMGGQLLDENDTLTVDFGTGKIYLGGLPRLPETKTSLRVEARSEVRESSRLEKLIESELPLWSPLEFRRVMEFATELHLTENEIRTAALDSGHEESLRELMTGYIRKFMAPNVIGLSQTALVERSLLRLFSENGHLPIQKAALGIINSSEALDKGYRGALTKVLEILSSRFVIAKTLVRDIQSLFKTYEGSLLISVWGGAATFARKFATRENEFQKLEATRQDDDLDFLRGIYPKSRTKHAADLLNAEIARMNEEKKMDLKQPSGEAASKFYAQIITLLDSGRNFVVIPGVDGSFTISAKEPAPLKPWQVSSGTPSSDLRENVRSERRSEMREANRKDDSWWRDASRIHAAISVPIYALRRAEGDPGIGKYTDLGRYFQNELVPNGIDTVLLLPHFATADESPYAPVSMYALNELYVDWAEIPEVAGSPELLAVTRAAAGKQRVIDYASVRSREREVSIKAFGLFEKNELRNGTERAKVYQDFLGKFDKAWLQDYADFMAIHGILGRGSLEWTPAQIVQARSNPEYEILVNAHKFSQWVGYCQLAQAIEKIHDQNGKVLFDIPMFRAKDSVDVWKEEKKYFKDVKTRNPGLIRDEIHESWEDLALWNWKELDREGFSFILAPFRYWLNFSSETQGDTSFDGARVDAFHFAYDFGYGQMKSGDEPGNNYTGAIVNLFKQQGALPLAEAFEGKDREARGLGFITVQGENGAWQAVTTHDDRRKETGVDFIEGFNWWLSRFRVHSGDWSTAQFVAMTLGDLWSDPRGVKESVPGGSAWRYRIPMPSDEDYLERAPVSLGSQVRMRLEQARNPTLYEQTDLWARPEEVRQAFLNAARSFMRRPVSGKPLELWAASRDWFLEQWGRDTFIALPGILLATGRFEDAKEIMRSFAAKEKKGLIPNRIYHDGKVEYNTVDGSLWFIQAVEQYFTYTGDQDFVNEMLPVCKNIISAYEAGTTYSRAGRILAIKMDPSDGLIISPQQATWMDADPDGRGFPITPRDGKAVEINALWYRSLKFLAEASLRNKAHDDARIYSKLAMRVKNSFNEKFWNPEFDAGRSAAPLFDVIQGDPNGKALRPNMLIAVSRGGDLLPADRQRKVFDVATKELLTSKGMRTLSPSHDLYQSEYHTEQPAWKKDQAYHQGTAWPWLIGPYVDTLVRIRVDEGRSPAEIRKEIQQLLTPLVRFLILESPVGSINEVFDGGDPKNTTKAQRPGGTSSQAWSVAEVMRILAEYGVLSFSPNTPDRIQRVVEDRERDDSGYPQHGKGYQVLSSEKISRSEMRDPIEEFREEIEKGFVAFEAFKSDAMVRDPKTQKFIFQEMLEALQSKGFGVVALGVPTVLTEEEARKFYAVHQGQWFYEPLVAYIREGMIPVLFRYRQGNAVEALRKILPELRQQFGVVKGDKEKGTVSRNKMHASDSIPNVFLEGSIAFRSKIQKGMQSPALNTNRAETRLSSGERAIDDLPGALEAVAKMNRHNASRSGLNSQKMRSSSTRRHGQNSKLVDWEGAPRPQRSETRNLSALDALGVPVKTPAEFFALNQKKGGGSEMASRRFTDKVMAGIIPLLAHTLNAAELLLPAIAGMPAIQKFHAETARRVLGLAPDIGYAFILGADLALRKGMIEMAKTVFKTSSFAILVKNDPMLVAKAEALIKREGLENRVFVITDVKLARARISRSGVALKGLISSDELMLAEELKEELKDDILVMDKGMQQRFLNAVGQLFQSLADNVAAQFALARSA